MSRFFVCYVIPSVYYVITSSYLIANVRNYSRNLDQLYKAIVIVVIHDFFDLLNSCKRWPKFRFLNSLFWGASIQNDHKWHIWLDKWPTKCQKSKHIISKLLRSVNLSEEITNSKFLKNLSKMRHFGDLKYVGVQSWKAAHLPTLEIRLEQKGNRVKKERKIGERRKISNAAATGNRTPDPSITDQMYVLTN